MFMNTLGELDLTYVGFSATPNDSTMQALFSSKPFHVYAMHQAIQEERFLVLENYTNVRLEVETAIPRQVEERLDKLNALRSAMDYASGMDRILTRKVDKIMVDFQQRKRAFARGKALIIARSRMDVLRYYRMLLQRAPVEWALYCALSSHLVDPNSTKMITEKSENTCSIVEADMIVACDKLDTGFNEPVQP